MPSNPITDLASPATRPKVGLMSNKQLVSDLLVRLPDDVSLHTIAKEVEFMAGVREGIGQLDRGEGKSVEAVEKMIASWSLR